MSIRRLDPRLDDHTGGVVVVTRFVCPQRWMLLWLRRQHGRVRAAVSDRSTGFVAAAFTVERAERTAYSVTLWRNPRALYDMGEVPEHIEVVKRAGRLGIRTDAAVFPYLDHWSNLLFGARLTVASPLSTDGKERV